MTSYVPCAVSGCREEAYVKITYLENLYGVNKGFRCLKHTKEIGDHDLNGRLDDKRRKQ